MSAFEIIGVCASMLLAAAAVAVGVLTMRRRASKGAAGPVDADRACKDIRELMEQLDRLAGTVDGKIESRLNEMRQALSEAAARIAELRELAACDTESVSPHKRPIKIGQAATMEILRLARSGADPVEIARTMKMDVGEVELVLSLNRSQRLKQA